MTREFLEEKGITDKETINEILNKFHEGIKDYKDNAERVKTLETENDNLKKQISERDKDLKELKKVDVSEMQNKIDELENKNKTQKEEYDKQLIETRKGITIDDNGIKGLDEQIKSLQESDSYLFNLEQQTKTVDLGGEHQESTKKEPSNLVEALHEKYDN